jgi:hypothetical protein
MLLARSQTTDNEEQQNGFHGPIERNFHAE